MRSMIIAVVMLFASINLVSAGTVKDGTPLWPTKEALKEAVTLITSGDRTARSLAILTTSCIVQGNSSAVRLEGIINLKLIITSGPSTGCTGWTISSFYDP